MKLTIIIPAYNEEKSISKVLNRIYNTKPLNIEYEVIVVNDASSDRTKLEIEKDPNLFSKFINNQKNLGKGGSIKKALDFASGDYVIFQDADLEYDPAEFIKFIEVIERFNPDIVIGSRFNYDKFIRSHNFLNKLGNYIITNLFNLIYNTTFNDIYSCYLCYRKNLIKASDLKTNGFEQQAEILSKIVKKSKVFYEVPINYNGRSFEEGKKIKFYHIFSVIFEIIKGKI